MALDSIVATLYEMNRYITTSPENKRSVAFDQYTLFQNGGQ